ncbi:MAG: hypothetical protein IJU23_06395 [Proteobacteria bacterium]|nr:hypothetical protein [Pseudomonadota bacterium]
MKKIIVFSLLALMTMACSEQQSDTCKQDTSWQKVTYKFSKDDNIESVRVTNAVGDTAIVVASKAKTVYRVNPGSTCNATETIYQAEGMTKDEEFTNSAAINETDYALTHTLLLHDPTSDKITSCGGELILHDGKANKDYVVKTGPMPDSVAISPDKKYAITADEHDDETDAWGKCPIASEKPGISIIDLSNGLASAKVVKQIQFTRNIIGPREPEYVAIASDNDTVAVTLQDSHEVAIFSIKAILNETGDTLEESVTKIVQLPPNPANQNPWPDGIVSFTLDNKIYFAIAGEWNDTIIIIDDSGNVISNTYITEKDVPTNFPCVEDTDSPRYSPDSITAYIHNNKQYIASTLKFAGAVIVYDVSDPAKPVMQFVEKVGEEDIQECTKKGSTVSPEGISAGSGYIWTANEKENSVTVIKL